MSQLARINTGGVKDTNTNDLHKYLCFYLGEKMYGVNILRIKEIIEHIEVAPIPMMPEFFWGAINLRGKVVPIVDLSQRLGMKRLEEGRRTCFVIVEVSINGQVMDAGVVVDAVNQVADIPPENREPSPSFGGNIKNEYVESLGKVNEKFVILLAIDRVLSMQDLVAFQQSTESLQAVPEQGSPELENSGLESSGLESSGLEDSALKNND